MSQLSDTKPTLGFAVLLTALVANGPVSTDLYLPSLPDLTGIFGATVSQVQLTLSAYVAGFGLCQLFYGPLSDRFGRRPVLLWGAMVYVLATFACLLAPTIGTLTAARFFQAIGGGAGVVVARAVIRDVYGRDGAARMYAYTSSAMALAPLVAPFIGGALHGAFGWRANFGLLLVYGVGILAAGWTMLPETNPHADREALNLGRILRNYGSLLGNGAFLGYALCAAFSFASLFAFISGSSFTLIDVLGFKPETFGFGFAVAVGGYILGAVSGGRTSKKFGIEALTRVGVVAGLLAGTVAAGLAWAGMETLPAVLGPIFFIFAACGLVMPSGMAGAIGPFPHMAGAASALIGFLQLSIGGLAGYSVGVLFDGTTRPMPTVMAIMSLLAFMSYWLLVRGRIARVPSHPPSPPESPDGIV